MLNSKGLIMKKQILIIAILSLAQGIIAMEPLPEPVHLIRDANSLEIPIDALLLIEAEKEFYKAAEEGDYNKVAKLLESGANANSKGDYDESALAVAARQGHEEIVKLLLENHALVDAREMGGTTPLMWASTADIVELLLRAGADINAVDNEGRSVLRHAVARPNFYVLQSLLENGASIESSVISYNPVMAASPLMTAAESGNEELVMLLLITPTRKMIIRALAGLKAIQKSQKPSRDVLWLLKKTLVAQLVQNQMDLIGKATTYRIGADGLSASDIASSPDLSTLLDPNNPASVARIRQRVEENISRFIFGEPRQPLEPAQGLTQEEVDDIMGSWLPERE